MMKVLWRNMSWGLAAIIIILILCRIALPYVVQGYVNRTIDRIPEYEGSVGDIDINLWRGAYAINDIELNRTTGRVPVPFFSCLRADFSVEWNALFRGKVVGELYIDRGHLNFVNGPTDEESQTSVDEEWLQVVKDLFPLRLNHFELADSEIHYRDFHSTPKVNVRLTDVNLTGDNFSNTLDPVDQLESIISARGKMEESAEVVVNVKLTPAAAQPTFDLNGSVEVLPATKLNDVFKAYGNVDAEKGTIGLYTELAAKNGEFRGYIKPIIKDLHLISLEQDKETPLQAIWESLVAALAEVFTNQSTDQIASVIPISGKFEDPKVGRWQAFLEVIKNAFIEAIKPGTDNKIMLAPEAIVKESE